ncbi:MAG TPA: CYTH domain-containing protein [Xanthomonadaceae bacterium]|jgi:adenylate cyclase|nr:CYTH domain-containing protein [Xanthomonadaceae bacterium]
MGIEIERKFTVVDESWRSHVAKSARMAQGYLNDMAAMRNGTQKASVRVRIADDQAFLNMKSRELGHTRQEFEYEIPKADAESLLKLCVGGLIEKTRHYVTHAGFVWEIDVFEGANAGLTVAEIELPSADAVFEAPGWIGREVTDELRYYNLSLAERPYSQWRPEEKR